MVTDTLRTLISIVRSLPSAELPNRSAKLRPF
jgi:hypothetical protein